MAEEQQGPDRLLVMVDGQSARVRVEGRPSFRVSPSLKEFVVAAIERGVRRLVVDFQACAGMDSTFMGVLAGLAFRFRKAGGEGVFAVNLPSKTRSLLSTLGLDRVVNIQDAERTPAPADGAPAAADADAATLPPISAERRQLTETMLEAHEDLVRASPDNLSKFKDVLQFLREDLRKSEGAEP